MNRIYFFAAAFVFVLGTTESFGEKNKDGVRDTGRVNVDAQRLEAGKAAAGRATETLVNPGTETKPKAGSAIPSKSALNPNAPHAVPGGKPPENPFTNPVPGTGAGRPTDLFAKKEKIEAGDARLKGLDAKVVENGARVENLSFGDSAKTIRFPDADSKAIEFGSEYVARVSKLKLPKGEKDAVLASLKIFLLDVSRMPKAADQANAKKELDAFLKAFEGEFADGKTPAEKTAAAKFMAGSLAFYGKDSDPNSDAIDLKTPQSLWFNKETTGDHKKGLSELYGAAAEIEASYVAAEYKKGNSFTGTGDKRIDPLKVWENTRQQMADWTQVRLVLNGTSVEEAKKVSEQIMCCTNHGSLSSGCKAK